MSTLWRIIFTLVVRRIAAVWITSITYTVGNPCGSSPHSAWASPNLHSDPIDAVHALILYHLPFRLPQAMSMITSQSVLLSVSEDKLGATLEELEVAIATAREDMRDVLVRHPHILLLDMDPGLQEKVV